MTDVDEHLLTAAKLAEATRGDLESPSDLHRHAGLVEDDGHRDTLSFVAAVLEDGDHGLDVARFGQTSLGRELVSKFATDRADHAVEDGNSTVMSHLVGVTESDLSGDSLTLHARLDKLMANHGSPCFAVAAGNPNTGKTNTMSLLAELRSCAFEDYRVLSNVRSWERTDDVVTGAHDLAVTLLQYRDVPKFVLIDESSTHFDARTYRREVATQWTPLAKRFAKIGVDACGNVIHTGKDAHPELKRMATLAYFKTEKKVAEFYERWPADGDFPTDQLFGGSIEDLEPTGYEADPNDASPWAWNLEPDLFSEDLRWPDLLDALRARGPAE